MDTAEAVVFDAYGTLFDVHSVAERGEELFPGRGADLSRLWRTKQLEYTWLRSLMGRYEDFESVTRAALRFACRALGLACSEQVQGTLMHEYLRLAPYPEVDQALRALAARRLAILSNGSPAMLQAVVEHAGLAPLFHSVLSVDELRIYKPHPSVYQLAVERLATAKERIVFVSSNFWDVSGATAFGFRTYWIDRIGGPADELGLHPAGTLRGLDELADVLS